MDPETATRRALGTLGFPEEELEVEVFPLFYFNPKRVVGFLCHHTQSRMRGSEVKGRSYRRVSPSQAY